MIPNSEPTRGDIIRRMLDYLIDNEDKLTEWESNFSYSLDEQFREKKKLSDRQCEILEKIYDKVA